MPAQALNPVGCFLVWFRRALTISEGHVMADDRHFVCILRTQNMLSSMEDNNVDFSMVLWTGVISALPIHLGNWSLESPKGGNMMENRPPNDDFAGISIVQGFELSLFCNLVTRI